MRTCEWAHSKRRSRLRENRPSSTSWDEQQPCEGAALAVLGDNAEACRHSGPDEIIAGSVAPTPTASATFAPETAGYRDYGQRVRQAKWTSPQTNRFLLEGGVGQY